MSTPALLSSRLGLSWRFTPDSFGGQALHGAIFPAGAAGLRAVPAGNATNQQPLVGPSMGQRLSLALRTGFISLQDPWKKPPGLIILFLPIGLATYIVELG